MNDIVGRMNILFVTLDTLRYDVAVQAFRSNRTPHLQSLFPDGWEERHSPATFTYAAHQAFFTGFLPTPAAPGRHERLFAATFEGSETTTSNTYVFSSADLISGLRLAGYKTACVGGVGFFNKRTPLGDSLPSMFDESYWEPAFGVTDPDSTRHQFQFAAGWIGRTSSPYFLFINVSAIHQPNAPYIPGAAVDSIDTHRAALEYVDRQWPLLTDALRAAGDTFCIVCSDHGTAYGEDGYFGHRISHPTVLTVPYAHFILRKA